MKTHNTNWTSGRTEEKDEGEQTKGAGKKQDKLWHLGSRPRYLDKLATSGPVWSGNNTLVAKQTKTMPAVATEDTILLKRAIKTITDP